MSEEPFVVKLQFEPAGRPESPGDYYLMVKENLCVVCGKKDSYIRCVWVACLSASMEITFVATCKVLGGLAGVCPLG